MSEIAMTLKFPERRMQLLRVLDHLADAQYQREVWVKQIQDWKRYGKTVDIQDNFDEQVHFLFDDTSIADAPLEEIGYTLISLDEAKAVGNVIRSLERLLDIHGTKLDDEQYISTREWHSVIDAAIIARSLLSKAVDGAIKSNQN